MRNEINGGAGYTGHQEPTAGASEFNVMYFIIKNLLGRMATATLVQVKNVTNAGEDAQVGFVDILPLVNQQDGNGNQIPHGVIFGVPYMRLQGGANAVILDPQVGDIGMAVFASRDISSVVVNRAAANPQSPPGSWRQYDMADALYIGGFLNGIPTQYVQFNADGITVHSPTKVTIDAPTVKVHATQHWKLDVFGYGQMISNDGSGNITIDNYVTGAVVTTTNHAYSPPEIP